MLDAVAGDVRADGGTSADPGRRERIGLAGAAIVLVAAALLACTTPSLALASPGEPVVGEASGELSEPQAPSEPQTTSPPCTHSLVQGGCPWQKTTTIFIHGFNFLNSVGAALNCESYWGSTPAIFQQLAGSVGGTPEVVNLGYYGTDEGCTSKLSEYGATTTATSIVTIGEHLRKYLDAKFANQYVNIVAHSMGGLITRAALRFGEGPVPKINHVVTLDTPHTGTALTCPEFFTGSISTLVNLLGSVQATQMCRAEPKFLDLLSNVPASSGRTTYWATIGENAWYCWAYLGLTRPPGCADSPVRPPEKPWQFGDGIVETGSELGGGVYGSFTPDVSVAYGSKETGTEEGSVGLYTHLNITKGDIFDEQCERGHTAPECASGQYYSRTGAVGESALPTVRLMIPLALAGSPAITSVTRHGSEVTLSGTGFGFYAALNTTVKIEGLPAIVNGFPVRSSVLGLESWSDNSITFDTSQYNASCTKVSVTNAIGLSSAGACIPASPPPPPPAPPGSPPLTIYIGVHEASVLGGAATTQTGAGWNYTNCSFGGWYGGATVGGPSNWQTVGDTSEAWANGVGGNSTTLFWWTAGINVLSPEYTYKIYADIDTCNAGSTAAWYTIAGNDGAFRFGSGDSGQHNVKVDQASTNGYVLLGEEETGESGITIAAGNGGGANGTVGVADIKLVRGLPSRRCHPKEPCAE
jgi:pimeloyl-ACP methyl ester carboxylesterase